MEGNLGEILIGIGLTVLGLGGGGAGATVMWRRKNGSNNDKFVTKELCQERHTYTEKTVERIESKVDSLEAKMEAGFKGIQATLRNGTQP
jgi:hypothetical protein